MTVLVPHAIVDAKALTSFVSEEGVPFWDRPKNLTNRYGEILRRASKVASSECQPARARVPSGVRPATMEGLAGNGE